MSELRSARNGRPAGVPGLGGLGLGFLAASLMLGAGAPSRLACAQSVPPPETSYAALRWRLLGPHRGGRVLGVAGIPGDATTFYFGAVDGGVWRTTNAGLTWEPLFDREPVASVGTLAIAPSNPKVVYVGTGEASIRSDITFGAGVYKSTDGGARWRFVGLEDTRHIGRILIDPKNPDVVLVAALGHAYGPNPERGVFRSTDGGRTWTKVLYKNPDTGAIDLAADPGDPQVIYAALWQARRTPWEQYQPDEGPGSGLYKSSDGGLTWAPLAGHGLPAGPLGRIGLAVARGGRVYALIGAAQGAGLYRSDDGGTTWLLAGADPRLTSRNWYFCRVTVNPQNPDVVYVPNVALLKSADGGKTFTALKGQPGGDDYHELWIDPKNPAHMIVGSDQGAVISLDGGQTWSSWYNQPTAATATLPLHLDLAHRIRSQGPAHLVHRRAERALHAGRRAALAGHQPRSDGCLPPSQRSRSGQRTRHGRERRGARLRRDLYDRTLAPRGRHDLGRPRRRAHPPHYGSRQQLAERHAGRAAALEHDQPDRGVAVRHGRCLRRRGPASPGRLRPLPLPHPRRRPPLDAHRSGDRGARLRAGGPRRSGPAGTAVRRDRAGRLHLLRRRRSLAVAAAQPAGRLGARPCGPRQRPRRGYTRPSVLDPRRPDAPPAAARLRPARECAPVRARAGYPGTAQRQQRHAAAPRGAAR